MARYLVATRRERRGEAPSAAQAVAGQPGISIVSDEDPELVIVEATDGAAEGLRDRLAGTHHVEPIVTRDLH